MAHLMVQHPVNDIVEWRKDFDSAARQRADSGVRSTLVFQEADDPHMVTVLLELDSPKQTREFADDPRLEEELRRHGVQSAPSFYFLKEV
jgi:hypothetical protein